MIYGVLDQLLTARLPDLDGVLAFNGQSALKGVGRGDPDVRCHSRSSLQAAQIPSLPCPYFRQKTTARIIQIRVRQSPRTGTTLAGPPIGSESHTVGLGCTGDWDSV